MTVTDAPARYLVLFLKTKIRYLNKLMIRYTLKSMVGIIGIALFVYTILQKYIEVLSPISIYISVLLECQEKAAIGDIFLI